MQQRSATLVEQDWNEAYQHFQQVGYIVQPRPKQILDLAQKIHKTTYSVIMWRFVLKKLPEHSRVFIDELASDALQILPQILLGYNKTSALLVRGMIENVLRHIYFHDHRIEFIKMNSDDDWYPQMEILTQYAKSHPSLKAILVKFNAVDKLKSIYVDLSRSVHGRKVEDMNLLKILQQIQCKASDMQVQEDYVRKVAESVNFLLIHLHYDTFGSLSQDQRKILLSTLPPDARRALRGLEKRS